MTRIQVKCRRCRVLLLSEESLINSHGDPMQEGSAKWDCSGVSGPERTLLFVSLDHSPPWIMDAVVQACYTQGKILCPKCEGRLGSFNFVKSIRKCACGETTQPPVHLLCDRVDVFDTNHQSQVVVPVIGHRATALSDDTGIRTVTDGNVEGVELQSNSCESDLSYGHERQGSNSSTGSDNSVDLRLLFGEHKSSLPMRNCNSVPWTTRTRNLGRENYAASSFRSSIKDTKSRRCENDLSSIMQAAENRTRGLDRLNQQNEDSRDAATAGVFGERACLAVRSANQRRRGGRNVVDGAGMGLSGCGLETDAVPLSYTASTSGKQRKHFVLSPMDREREKKERKEEEEKSLQQEDVVLEHTCPMCLEVLWNPHTTLPCRHNFCECCLRRLGTISTPVKTDCPLCRQRIAECVRNPDLEKLINKQYPIHIKVRRREEKRMNQKTKNIPLPGLAFPQNYLSRLQRPSTRFGPASKGQLAFMIFNVFVVMALSYVGMGICWKVLSLVAGVFDGVMEKLTGEKLWSEFMGVESRMMTVSCVFVLYLICACMVKYLRIFREIQD